MATLQTKYVNVGYGSTINGYGFYSASVFSTLAFGSISNTSGGSSNQDLEDVFTGEDVHLLYYHVTNAQVVFRASGTHSNAGFDSIDIAGTTFNRSDATHTQNAAVFGVPAGTTWTWDTNSNPFGTTTGANKQVEWDDGQAAATPTAPTDITFGSDPGTYSSTVSITATASGGTNGTMKVSADGTTWVANGSSFTFTRNTAKTIYARTEGSGSNSSNYSESHTVGYLSPDLNVSVSRNPSGDLASDYTGNVVVTISNGTANNRYRVLRTTGGNSGKGNTGNLTGTSGTVTLHNADAGDLPTAGNAVSYVIQGRLDTAKGGNNTYANTNASFSISRLSDNAPNAFTFTDVTDVTRSTTQISNQITVAGLGSGVSANVTVTGGHYSKNGGNYVNTATTAVNGDTFRVQHTASSSFGTTVNTTLTIGGVSDTYSSTTEVEDTTPASFSFTDVTDVARSTTKTSNQITITGINSAAAVSITGGTYSKNSGSYTSSAGTALNNDTFTVRHTSSSSFNTATNTTLTVGGVSDTYTSTTIAQDTTPNAFTFADVTGVSQSTTQTSNTITVSGINSSASVSVSGGTYSKNGGSYTSSAGTASNGDTFTVRHTSASDFNTQTNTTLTIGGVSDTYTSTTAAFSGNTYLVDVSVTQDLENSGLFIAHSGSFGATTTVAPRLLAAGDRVGFKVLSAPSGASVTVQGLSNDHWTSNSFLTLTSSYQYKYAKSGIPVDEVDTFNLTTTKTGFNSATTQLHVMGDSVQPDTSVDTEFDTYEISSAATNHTIKIVNTGSSTNASVTEYQVIDGSNSSQTFQSRTGHGELTVNSVPPNSGFPRTYALRARVTQANGGSGLYKTIGAQYNVIATTAATQSDPTIDSYGIAIYDHNGDAVTSFTSGHGLLRSLYVNNSVTLSTSADTEVSTGLTGISTSNCVILIEGTGATGAAVSPQAACTFTGTNPVKVKIAKVKSATTVKITVAQYKGTTIGATESYGFQLSNGNGDGVVDENSTCYAVKEIINLNPSASGQTLYQNAETNFLHVDLAQGDYPASGGVPIPCISSSKSVVLLPPTLSLLRHTDNSFKQVICYIPKSGTINGNYKLAMLVSSDNADPEYFGGTEPDYGLEIYKSNGDLAWHSGWRQAVLNNVIAANQFTAGTQADGDYDVTTGYDGVTAPVIIDNVTPYGMESTGQSVGISNLNEMDPAKTYVAGPAVTGSVHYYMGTWEDLEEDTQGYQGGGQHRPGIRITGLTSATIHMFRYSQGATPPTEDDAATRHPDSYHPEGHFLIFRIV